MDGRSVARVEGPDAPGVDVPSQAVDDLLAALGPGDLRLDRRNTTVSFEATWFGAVPVRGHFAELSGMIHVPDGDASRASVDVEVETASVRTGIALRDRHLCGATFLHAAEHPLITFRGGSLLRMPARVELPGSLTLRGTTATELLDVVLAPEASAPSPPIVARATIDRLRYGVGARKGIGSLSPLLLAIGSRVRLVITIRRG